VPRLADLDGITETAASPRTDEHYEHARSRDLLQVEVKKLGKIPPGGGWQLD
jgi:hypothetical protein